MSGEPRGQVTWGRPGAWPYACLALTTGGHLQHVHALAQQLKLDGTALAAGPNDAGDHIGDPQQWLGGSGYVVDTETTAFWQGKAGTLDCRDISAVEVGGSGLDEKVLHSESR